MMELPKLRVTWYSRNPEEDTICRFEDAKDVVFGHGLDVLIFVEGQMIKSYEELSRLAAQERFKNKDVLQVPLVSVVVVG